MRVITSNAEIQEYLAIASRHAHNNSGCLKVNVGSVIVKSGVIVSLGANRAMPDLCKGVRGCMRIEKYGDNAKSHRSPSDCRAIHSEIEAIAKSEVSLLGATIYVTRYPCEACARAIVASGIRRVVFGREQDISEETSWIFVTNNVKVTHFSTEEDDNIG